MKRLIFLLLLSLVLVVGMAFAMTDPFHPPGVNDSAVLAEFSVQQDVFAQPTVLVVLVTVDSNFQAVTQYDFFAILPQNYISLIRIPTKFIFTWRTMSDYYLRC
jgi:hypothetical protein